MKDSKVSITTDKCILKDEYIWYVSIIGSMICRTNVRTWETEIVEHIPKKYCNNTSYTYDCGIFYGDRLILAPKYEDWILDYDTISGKFDAYKIECSEVDGNTQNGNSIRFRYALIHEDTVWLMPQSARQIIEYRPKEKRYISHKRWYAELFEQYNWGDVTLFGNALKIKESIWLLCYEIGSVMEFNIITGIASLYSIGEQTSRYRLFEKYNDDQIILFDYVNKKLIIWDVVEKKMVRNISLIGVNYETNDIRTRKLGYVKLKAIENRFIMPPYLADNFIMININENDLQISTDISKPDNERYINAVILNDGKILFNTQSGIYNILFNPENDSIKRIKFEVELEQMSYDYYEHVFYNEMSDGEIMYENDEGLTLKSFINHIRR